MIAEVLLFAHGTSPGAPGLLSLAVTSGLVILGLAGLVSEVYALTRALSSRNWNVLDAEVTDLDIREHRGASGRMYYEPVVSFRYRCDGREFVATRAAFGNLSVREPAEAERFIAQFPLGARMPARVHARRPALAVLIPGPNRMIWSRLLFFAVFLCGATYGFTEVLRQFQWK